jgi:hypothetical protein
VETGLWPGHLGTVRRKRRQQTSRTYGYRATSRLYQLSYRYSAVCSRRSPIHRAIDAKRLRSALPRRPWWCIRVAGTMIKAEKLKGREVKGSGGKASRAIHEVPGILSCSRSRARAKIRSAVRCGVRYSCRPWAGSGHETPAVMPAGLSRQTSITEITSQLNGHPFGQGGSVPESARQIARHEAKIATRAEQRYTSPSPWIAYNGQKIAR